MSHIIISIWLTAAGSGVVLAEQPAAPAAVAQPASAGSQQLSFTADAKSIGEAVLAPVTSVTRLQRLPDGTLIQHCDTVPAKTVQRSGEGPRGEWIQLPEARIR